MADYLDLHLEVARHFEKKESQELIRAMNLLFDHEPQEAAFLLQSFPQYMFPFATEENWEAIGRKVKEGTNPTVTFPSGKEIYSVSVTEGTPIPTFPNQIPPPDIDQHTYENIRDWLDSLRKADDVGLVPVMNIHGMGGYNITRNEIVVPMGVPKQLFLWVYMYGYLAALKKADLPNMDAEDLDDYNGVIQTCVYHLLKERGYDSDEYGLNFVMLHLNTFERYLDVQDEIEELLDYFEPVT